MIHAGRLPIEHTFRDVGHCIHQLIPHLSIGAGHKFAALSYQSISGLQNLYYSALLINILELMHSVTYSESELSKLQFFSPTCTSSSSNQTWERCWISADSSWRSGKTTVTVKMFQMKRAAREVKVSPMPASELCEVSTDSRSNLSWLSRSATNFFSVDRANRWPVQGWTTSNGGERISSKMDNAEELKKKAAQENQRVFSINKASSRWPLQGWSTDEDQPRVMMSVSQLKDDAAASDLRFNSKSTRAQRWPQGW